MDREDVPQEVKESMLMSANDVNITAQCLTKAFAASNTGPQPKDVLDAYNFFKLELENGK